MTFNIWDKWRPLLARTPSVLQSIKSLDSNFLKLPEIILTHFKKAKLNRIVDIISNSKLIDKNKVEEISQVMVPWFLYFQLQSFLADLKLKGSQKLEHILLDLAVHTKGISSAV